MNPTRRSRRAGAGVDAAWADDRAWEEKLARDRETADRIQTPAQRAITETLLQRSLAGNARACALTGSTARNRRTAISDLDYHLVGRRPRHDDLPEEVDVCAVDADRFWRKLRSGDDFVQWTLRFGCILFDSGILRAGMKAIATEDLWPDPEVQLARLPELRRLGGRLIEMGDRDAAQDQVRAALTSAARAALLEAGVFPLARSELPDQLCVLGREELAKALGAVIHAERSIVQLRQDLSALDLALARIGE